MYGGIILEDSKGQKEGQILEQDSGTEVTGTRYASNNGNRSSLSRFIRNKYFLIAVGLISIIIITVGAMAMIYTKDQEKILVGITISGLDVGNLSQNDAKKIVDNKVDSLLDQSLILNVGQQSTEVKLEDLGLELNTNLALKEAFDLGKKGSIFEKVSSKMAAQKGINIDLSQEWDESTLSESLRLALEDFSRPSTDATFQISKDNAMTIIAEQVGLVINYESLMKDIKEINIYKVLPVLDVLVKEESPLVTAAQLEDQKITGLLATYTTRFDPSQAARSENVRIAAKALDMAVIKPEATLSFNQIVGERTVAGGYKDAYIIVNGKFVPGLAGGICQVSSTLYNTGLLANLAVTQRSNHDLAISYVPLGQDATVAFPDLDLKFNNNSGGYLLVRTKMSYNTITIELYGRVIPGQEVSIANTVMSVIPSVEQRLVDETMAPGTAVLKQQGQPGYTVKSSRTVKVNGVVVSSEALKQSRYVPLPTIYAVGQ